MIRHRIVAAALLMSVAAAAPLPGQSGPTDPFIAGDRMRRACDFAKTHEYGTTPVGSPAKGLSDFCALKAPDVDPAWATAEVPTSADVTNAANGTELSKAVVKEQAKGLAAGISNVFGNVALPDQGVILVGFTQFVTTRAKQEVTTYIVNRFATSICRARIAVQGGNGANGWSVQESMNVFLPSTCALLSTGTADQVLGRGYGLPSWSVVRTSLRSDADQLPDVVIGRFQTYGSRAYHDLSEHRDNFGPAQRLMALLAASRLGATYMRQHDLPAGFRDAGAEVIKFARAVCPIPKDGTCALDWRNLTLARDILVSAATVGAVSPTDFRDAGTDTVKLDAATLYAVKALAVNLRAGTDVIDPALSKAFSDYLNESGMSSGGGRNSVPFNAAFWQVARSLVHAVADGNARTAAMAADAKADRVAVLTAYADALVDIEPDLLSVASAITSADARQVAQVVQRVSRYPAMRVRGDYGAVLNDLMTMSLLVSGGVGGDDLRNTALPPAVVRTMQFVVDGAQSTDADAFEAVLQSYAAGPSAYMHKRMRPNNESRWYWSINAYVGAAIGQETAFGRNLPSDVRATYSGLAIPVGAEGGVATSAGAVGLLFQVADVGQVASWRSGQSASAPVKTTPPSLTFASVFAPGVDFLWNIPSVPVAFGTGMARVPQFRTIMNVNDATTTEPKANVWRWTVFAAVDVPLLP